MGSVAYRNLIHPELSASPEIGKRPEFGRPHDSAMPYETRGRNDDGSESRMVRALQTARRRRDAFFDSELFADPAWDLLLELYAVHLEQRRVSVSSLCIAAYVPATTALRWIAKLEEDGFAHRSPDPLDARRAWIELSPEGVERMRGYFEMLPFGTFSV